MRIGLVNYGGGNVSSVANALHYIDANFVEVCQPCELTEVEQIILPGVGAFSTAMKKLLDGGWVEVLKNEVKIKGKPFLGICLGMQLLATTGTEFQECCGLDLIEGAIQRIASEEHGLPVPHMGWNEVHWEKPSPLTNKLGDSAHFYFVHSYHFIPKSRTSVLGVSHYGSDIVSVIEKGNIWGVQFHPEKSQHEGLQLLRNFASIA